MPPNAAAPAAAADTPITTGALHKWVPWIVGLLVMAAGILGSFYSLRTEVADLRAQHVALAARVTTVEGQRREDRALLERVDRNVSLLACELAKRCDGK